MRIALVNQFENKFNAIHKKHLEALGHEVGILIADPKKQQAVVEVCKWADVVVTCWADWTLGLLASEPRPCKIISWLRSYEALTPEYMTGINWDRVTGVIYVADHIRRYVHKAWPFMKLVPSEVIWNGVDLDDYPAQEHAPGRNIAYLGYLNHKKGVELLAQCIAALPDHRFHIGGTFQEERFRVYWNHFVRVNALGHRVTMHGWVENVPEFLADMNYIISTSPWEGCPWNIIEAMACGVLPLVHNWPGASELFGVNTWNTITELEEIFYGIASYGGYGSDPRQIVADQFNAVTKAKDIDAALTNFMARKRIHWVPFGDANSAGTRLRAMEPALLIADDPNIRASIGPLGPWSKDEIPAVTILQRVYGSEIDPVLDEIRGLGGKVILELCDYYPAQETSKHVDAFTTCSEGNVSLFLAEGFQCPGMVVDDTLDYGLAHDWMRRHPNGEPPSLCWYGTWNNDYKSDLLGQIAHLPGPIHCITGPAELSDPFVHVPWQLETFLSEMRKHHICLLPQILDDPINNAHRAATSWAAGLCVIATDCVEFRKLFETAGLQEYLCRTPDDWTNALTKLQTRESRIAYLAKAQPVAWERHGPQAIRNRWLGIIKEVTNAS